MIEHIFGVLKRRFRILLIPPEYSVKVQAQIPSALCAIHNFIQIHDSKSIQVPTGTGNPGDNLNEVRQCEEDTNVMVSQVDDVDVRRDKIAEDMWTSYQIILEARRHGDMGENESDLEDSDEEEEASEDEEYYSGDEEMFE